MGSVVVSSTFTLSSSAADIWPLITDTDRTNRLVLGTSNVYKPIEPGKNTSARFLVSTKAAGFTMEYEEAPFEWTLHKSFSVFRKMRSGPLVSYTYAIKLDPASDGGTKITMRLDLVPRHWVLRPIAEIEGRRIVARMGKVAEAIDAHLRDKAPSPYVKPVSPPNMERLAYCERELKKRDLDPKVVAELVDLIRNGPDADLVRIRPFELASDKGVDEREMLRACLHAVTLGVVELRWALVCPSCRTANDQVTSLAEIGDDSHCQLCDLSYGIELDRAVEATFIPHPSVREVSNQMFCIGGPYRTPHVVIQATVDARAKKEIATPAEAGRYRFFARGGAVSSLDVKADAPKTATITLKGEAVEPAELEIAPGGRITVDNQTSQSLHVKIERLGYASKAATAHEVTTMSEFRRFFSKDLLKPSTPLKVASCAILFSDLTGSTALYTTAGDAAAFRLVDDHFDLLRKVIDQYGGTVVKTMGDAIMAAFIEPMQCVRASVACLHAFEMFRAEVDNGELTGIKLGIYAGPCYVVTANDAIDYFGQTVNCASRVQHCAETGEIVFEEDIWDRMSDEDRVRLRLVDKLETKVKGVAHPLKLVRTKLTEDIVKAPETADGSGQGAKNGVGVERLVE
jgi:class 3 adenylate cyclase